MNRSKATADTKTQTLQSVATFLSRYRRAIVVLLIALAVGAIALVVALSIQNNRAERALERTETLQDEYREWLALGSGESDDRSEQFEGLVENGREIIQEFPETYAATRASMILAEGYFALERWQEAADAFVEVATVAGEAYLATVARMGAAAAYENAGDQEAALEQYRQVVDNNDSSFGFAPRALFSVGRIEEGRNEIVAASEAYQGLIDDYPTSSWTNLARNRIITLTVEGRIGE